MLVGPVSKVIAKSIPRPIESELIHTERKPLVITEEIRTWAVFILCFVFGAVGVIISFLVFGESLSEIKNWGISIIVSIGMLSINYGQKFVKVESRTAYLLQGFLWPSTWPTLAHTIGISSSIIGPVAPPGKQTGLELLLAMAIFFS